MSTSREERPHPLPVRSPGQRHHRVALGPLLLELGQRRERRLLGFGRVHPAQVGDQGLAIDPGHEPRRAADQAHDAGLHEQWRWEYNTQRPHSSLDYRTPSEVGAEVRTAMSGESGAIEIVDPEASGEADLGRSIVEVHPIAPGTLS